jgi:hypothetical protein
VASAVHLGVKNVHRGNVVASFDETVTERSPDESRPASDEHGC